MMKFGERLKKARLDLNQTQEVVAKNLHVSRQTISSWENERSYPDINSLIQLSDYYHLSLDKLLKEDIGMIEDLEKKEQLAQVNKIWTGLYGVNLLLVIAILLGNIFHSEMFAMGIGIQLTLAVITLLNGVLLLRITKAKEKLGAKKSLFCSLKSKKNFTILLSIECGLLILGLFLWLMKVEQAFSLLGFSTGSLVATLFLLLTKEYLEKNN